MSCADCLRPGRLLVPLLLPFLLALPGPTLAAAAEEFSFELAELEKTPLEWGGFGELRWEHTDANQDSLLRGLSPEDDPPATMDRLVGVLQVNGSYSHKSSSLHWLLQGAGQHDSMGWADSADIFELYGALKPAPHLSLTLGKSAYRWGKGYAWNPVGLINRRKDPNDPDEAREGYVTAGVDLIKSFSGKLQNVALTGVVLPVSDEINDDFGKRDQLNLAAKLYLLAWDTDIDLMLLAGDSRADAYGIDFAKNLASNFEVHGELAYQRQKNRLILPEDGLAVTSQEDSLSWLLGLRYLSASDVTTIVEYYHNEGGYSAEEMGRFYQLIGQGEALYQQTADPSLVEQARELSLKGYLAPQPGTDYLYCRFMAKEPFTILYFTPALTSIVNLDDESFSLTPELLYTGFTNWELRLRYSHLAGGTFSEFGEKLNSNKVELRLRYFFSS